MYYACFLLQYITATINLFAHSPILATMAICDNYIIPAQSPQKFITVRRKKAYIYKCVTACVHPLHAGTRQELSGRNV